METAPIDERIIEVYFRPNGGNGGQQTKLLYSWVKSPFEHLYYKNYVLLDPEDAGFSRTGYTLTAWKMEGFDETYEPGTKPFADFELKALPNNNQVVFLAQWTPIEYRVNFDANEGTGSIDQQPFTYDVEQPLSSIYNANGDALLSRPGYRFTGWNNVQNPTEENPGVTYSNAMSVKNLMFEPGEITLYAQWAKKTYAVSFNGNGGDLPSESEGVTAQSTDFYSQSFKYNQAFNLKPNKFVRDGYEFTGWSTKANGGEGATSYEDEATVTLTDSIKLYAQWEKLPVQTVTYTVKYNANGGNGEMAGQSITLGGETQNLTENTFTRVGYMFSGWNTADNGSGKAYKDAEKVENIQASNGDIIELYAQWTPITYFVEFSSDSTLEEPVEGLMDGQWFTYDEEQALLKRKLVSGGIPVVVPMGAYYRGLPRAHEGTQQRLNGSINLVERPIQ